VKQYRRLVREVRDRAARAGAVSRVTAGRLAASTVAQRQLRIGLIGSRQPLTVVGYLRSNSAFSLH
jgi:Mg-chelatase subunit ChlI